MVAISPTSDASITRSLHHFSYPHQTFSNTQKLSVLYKRFQYKSLQQPQRFFYPFRCSQFLIRAHELNQKRNAFKPPDSWHNPQLQQVVHLVRGGGDAASDDEEYDDEEDDEYEGDDDSDLFADDDNSFFNNDSATAAGGQLQNADFKEGSIVDRMLDAWNNKTPPLTKLYLTSSALVTLSGLFTLLREKLICTRHIHVTRPYDSHSRAQDHQLHYLNTMKYTDPRDVSE